MQSDQPKSFLPCDWTYQNSSCCDIGTIKILLCISTYQDTFHHAFEPFTILLALQFDQSGPILPSDGPMRSSLPYYCTNQNPPCSILGQSGSFLSSCRAIRLIRIRILHRCSPEIGGLRAKVHNPCRYEVHSHILFF
jgi:hypothetical protein